MMTYSCPRQMYTTRLLWLIGLLTLSGCQSETRYLIRSSDNRMVGPLASRVDSLRYKPVARLPVNPSGLRNTLPADSVWGYRTDWNRLIRVYNYKEYEVIQEDVLFIYRAQEWGTDILWDTYYFSMTPNSAIYALDRRTCQRVFRQDSCMQNLLKNMRTGQLVATDTYGSNGLVNAYKYCIRFTGSMRTP